MILKQKAFQKLAQIIKLKENQEKKCLVSVSNPNNKNSVCFERNSSTPIPLGHSVVDIKSVITCTEQMNRTSWLRENNDEKFGKITKICLLETKYLYAFWCITISLFPFYKLNFVSRRQFFINIGKYPSKMQKVRHGPFLGNKIFKRRALFLIKDDFFEDLYFD